MDHSDDTHSPITKIAPEQDARAKKLSKQGHVLTKHHKDARRLPDDCDPCDYGCSPSLPNLETLERNLR